MDSKKYDISLYDEVFATISGPTDYNQTLLNRLLFCLHNLAFDYFRVGNGAFGPLKIVLNLNNKTEHVRPSLAYLIELSYDSKIILHYAWANIIMLYLASRKVYSYSPSSFLYSIFRINCNFLLRTTIWLRIQNFCPTSKLI